MKSTVLKMSISALLLSLAACVETTSPVCDAGNAADLPGGKSEYAFQYMTEPGKPAESQKISIERLELGKYKFTTGGNSAAVNVCRVGRFIVGEVPTPFGTYKQHVMEAGANQTMNFSSWMFDSSVLAQQGVQSQVVTRKVDPNLKLWSAFMGAKDQPTEKVLVIDNSSAGANSVLSSLGLPNGLSMLLN